MTGVATPQEVLFRTAALLEDWPIWPPKPVTAAIAHAVGLDVGMWIGPLAHDAGGGAAAHAALLHLGEHLARRTGTEGVLTWENTDLARLALDIWACKATDRDAVLQLVTDAAKTAPAGV